MVDKKNNTLPLCHNGAARVGLVFDAAGLIKRGLEW